MNSKKLSLSRAIGNDQGEIIPKIARLEINYNSDIHVT